MTISVDSLRRMPSAAAVALILRELKSRTESNTLDQYYPDEGPMRRELYPKHIDFFAAGLDHRDRTAFGGNRVGKTRSIGGYETSVHLTGLYPDWWPGMVFNGPIEVWAAGKTKEKVRDINQKVLLGDLLTGKQGGLVPKRRIVRFSRSAGTANLIDQAVVRHVKGWDNVLTLKTYESGRRSFEGEGIHFIWLDEEPDNEIDGECKARTLTTKGHIIRTFTPLDGVSATVLKILQDIDFNFEQLSN
jgi:phage terminase large subunit-like protein